LITPIVDGFTKTFKCFLFVALKQSFNDISEAEMMQSVPMKIVDGKKKIN
jgi:hypothetical protein